MGRLDGKVCIVTGGNSGIGMKTAEVFGGEGAKLVLTDVSDSNKDKVLAKIKKQGGEAIFVKGDITSAEDNEELMRKAVETFGRIDVLVNCAGVLEKGLKPIEEFTDRDYDFVTNTSRQWSRAGGCGRGRRCVARRSPRSAPPCTTAGGRTARNRASS